MISRLYLDGFRHFKDFTIRLNSGSTLICGLNGSGKSSIIEVFHRLKLFLRNSTSVEQLCMQCDLPAWENLARGRWTTHFEFDFSIDAHSYNYKIEILHNLRDKLSRVEKENLSCCGEILLQTENGRAIVFESPNQQAPFPVNWQVSTIPLLASSNNLVEIFLNGVQNKIFPLSINVCKMDAFSRSKEKQLDFDGANFSSWYSWLKSNRLKMVVNAMDDIRQCIPNFNQFDLIEHGTSHELAAIMDAGNEETYTLPFESLSQGQKVLSLLYMLIRTCPDQSTILIDEMENHISPIELQPLYDSANDAIEETNTQFVFVSHNPKTINWYQAEAIILSQNDNHFYVKALSFEPTENINIQDRLWLERGNDNGL